MQIIGSAEEGHENHRDQAEEGQPDNDLAPDQEGENQTDAPSPWHWTYVCRTGIWVVEDAAPLEQAKDHGQGSGSDGARHQQSQDGLDFSHMVAADLTGAGPRRPTEPASRRGSLYLPPRVAPSIHRLAKMLDAKMLE
jgi:hypothetical protein